MTDTNHSDFDSGRSTAEKLQAEVLEANPDTYFVKYGEDDADIEPRTPLNELLFEAPDEVKDELYDLLVYGEPITWRWTEFEDESRLSSFLRRGDTHEHEMGVHAEDGGRVFRIEYNGDTVVVPVEHRQALLEYLTNKNRVERRRPIKNLFETIDKNQVNRNTVQAFLNRFDSDRVRPTDQGWIIDEAFLVRYDARNFLIDEPLSDDVVDLDESEEFVDIDFDINGEITETAPDGETYEIGEKEQRFLALVETMLYPEDYLGYDMAGRVVRSRRSDGPSDSIGQIASTAEDNGFRDPSVDSKSHGHSLDKHTLTKSFNVTDEVIDRLHFQQNTHGSVHELARRESEFRRADFDVFYDTDNTDDERWRNIKSRARSAPITDEAQRKMDSMFGSV